MNALFSAFLYFELLFSVNLAQDDLTIDNLVDDMVAILDDLKPCNYANRNEAISKIIPESYKKSSQLPDVRNLTVWVKLSFLNFFDIDEQQSTVSANLFLTRVFFEPRFFVKCFHAPLALFLHEMPMVWFPPVALTAMLKNDRTVTPVEETMTMIQSPGLVRRMDHLVVRLGCNMNFKRFPFDPMHCDFPITPPQFIYHTGVEDFVRFNLKFDKPPAEIVKSFNFLSSHEVIKTEALVLTSGDDEDDPPIPVVRVHFHRFYTHYIFHAYIPNTITVFVAYLSFFVDPTSIPGRITLGLSCLIAMVLQYGNIAKSMPKVGYVKSIDFWNIGCIGFIFISLLEFAAICYIRRSKNSRQKYIGSIDHWSSVFYPILFILFAVVYFTVSAYY